MKNLFLFILIGLFFSCSSEPSPCLVSEDFIKKDLKYPDEAEFNSFECNSEPLSDGSYVVLRKVTAKNAFGVKSEYVYKLKLVFQGGNASDSSNWKLLSIKSELYTGS